MSKYPIGSILSRLFIGLIPLLWLGCSSTPSGDFVGSGASPDPTILRVGIAPTSPPLAYKQNGELTGLEVEFARALAAEMACELRFVELKWDDLAPALTSGRIDIIMSGMTITPARSIRVAFVTPYLRSGQIALVRRTELARMRLMLMDPENRFGAQRGTTGDFFIQANLARSKNKLYKTAEAGARGLRKGEIDVFVHDAPVNWWLASESENTSLTPIEGFLTDESLAWAVRKNDQALFDQANNFMQKIGSSGKLRDIVGRWVPFQ